MTVTVQVLFDQPQHEIASLLRDRLTCYAELALFDTPARLDLPWQRVRGL